MSAYVDGYQVRIPYSQTSQPELSPAWIDHVALHAGLAPPRDKPGAPFTYCDLGCGQGLTPTLLAAAVPSGRFFGLDAMAAHTKDATPSRRPSSATTVLSTISSATASTPGSRSKTGGR